MKYVVVGVGNVGRALSYILAPTPDQDEVVLIDKGEYITSLQKVEKDINYAKDADIVLISVPTNYKEEIHGLDISEVEKVIGDILPIAPNAAFFIKSTMPVGGTRSLISKFNYSKIFYAPEFLRERQSWFDMHNIARLVVGTTDIKDPIIDRYFSLFETENKLLMTLEEAEAVKLFSNAYIATRVTFFNELDSFAITHNLNYERILKGICLDPRIGDYCNHSSFGYGGACLPKDIKELSKEFKDIPSSLISHVDEANEKRKEFMLSQIVKLANKYQKNVIGVYEIPKRGSVLDELLIKLSDMGYEILILDVKSTRDQYKGFKVCHGKNAFYKAVGVILEENLDRVYEDNSIVKKIYKII